jgi:mevalonate kinase
LPREVSAKSLIADIREAGLHQGSPEAITLARLGAYSREAVARLGGVLANMEGSARSGRLAAPSATARAIAELAKSAQWDLESLGLVTPGVAALLAAGEAQGALGGKMSGAGGGGAFWLLYEGRVEAEAGKSALQAQAERQGLAAELSLELLSTL